MDTKQTTTTTMPTTYTHLDFIDDVRRLVAKKLPPDQAQEICSIPLNYWCHIKDPGEFLKALIYHQRVLGDTVFDKNKTPRYIAIYADAEPSDRMLLAATVVHELGHWITPMVVDHGDLWAKTVQRLGLNAIPYPNWMGNPLFGNGAEPEHWTDPELYAAIKALPAITDYEAVQKDLSNL